jgi:LuxR family maltose regulon positive regulatory protein
MMILTSLAYAAGARPVEARQALLAALALAQPEGYQRLFLDEGAAMAALLRANESHIRGQLSSSYAQALLGAFAQEPIAPMAQLPALPVVLDEPLSPHEQRVFRLLAAGLSNPEIAQQLIVSVNTVKTQVQSIYRKLNITSRTEARLAARQLKLV